jgi:hypothetical protein
MKSTRLVAFNSQRFSRWLRHVTATLVLGILPGRRNWNFFHWLQVALSFRSSLTKGKMDRNGTLSQKNWRGSSSWYERQRGLITNWIVPVLLKPGNVDSTVHERRPQGGDSGDLHLFRCHEAVRCLYLQRWRVVRHFFVVAVNRKREKEINTSNTREIRHAIENVRNSQQNFEQPSSISIPFDMTSNPFEIWQFRTKLIVMAVQDTFGWNIKHGDWRR